MDPRTRSRETCKGEKGSVKVQRRKEAFTKTKRGKKTGKGRAKPLIKLSGGRGEKDHTRENLKRKIEGGGGEGE